MAPIRESPKDTHADSKAATDITPDGTAAATAIADTRGDVIAPSMPMGAWEDGWMAPGRKNMWDTTPSIVEMQLADHARCQRPASKAHPA